ncbi:tetratricopeptide repeat protein [Arenimonas sp.]|uniref:tetratricopeptide repeat protein n=1 Tax=Arenimonas sp. TaxID=1872635 RepID=UPI0039E57B13
MNETMQRLETLRGFLAQDPGNVPLACELLDAYMALGDYAAAQALLETLPTESREAAGVRFRQARAALIHGRYTEAAAVLQGLIDEGIENVALWHDLAFAQLCQRDTAAARATLEAAATHFGANVELLIVRARVAMMDGDFDLALATLADANALAPEHATVQGLRALALFDTVQSDAAYAAAKTCLARHPDQHEALIVAGSVALMRQAIDESETHFVRALNRHPNSGRCLSGFGQVRMLQNRLPDARDILRHAVVTMPDHIGTWHALAWAELLLGELDAAETSYQHAYDLDRNFADSHGGLALVHAVKGRHDEAEQAIRRALRLNPACPTALYARSLLLEDEGREDEAMHVLGGLVPLTGLPPGTDLKTFARALRSRFDARAR